MLIYRVSPSSPAEKRERADGSASVDYFFFDFLPFPPAAVGMHHRVRVAPLRVSLAMRSDIKKISRVREREREAEEPRTHHRAHHHKVGSDEFILGLAFPAATTEITWGGK